MFIENVADTLFSPAECPLRIHSVDLVGTICLLPCAARTYRPYGTKRRDNTSAINIASLRDWRAFDIFRIYL